MGAWSDGAAARWRRFGPAIGFVAVVGALLAVAQAPWRRWTAPQPAPFAQSFGTRPVSVASGAGGGDFPTGALTEPDDGTAVAVAQMEGQAGLPLFETFRWPLVVTRTGRAADATAVGLARTDGTSAGVIVINGRGALVQSIPGSEGPDGTARAAAWLKARGWTPAGP
jgi:hypothetical protein